MSTFGDALVVAAGGATFAGLVWIGRRILQLVAEARQTLQDWRGTPQRAGVDRVPGVLESLHNVRASVERVDRTLAAHLAYVEQEEQALKLAHELAQARRAGHEESTQLWQLMDDLAAGKDPAAAIDEETT